MSLKMEVNGAKNGGDDGAGVILASYLSDDAMRNETKRTNAIDAMQVMASPKQL